MLRRYSVVTAALLVALATFAPGSVVVADHDADEAAAAAAAIQEAQDRANAAATAYFEAEEEIDAMSVRLDELHVERDALTVEVDRLLGSVKTFAADQFVASSGGGIPLFTNPQLPTERQHAELYSSVVVDASATDLDDFDEARSDLADTEDDIEQQVAALEAAKEEHLELQEEAKAELERLKEVETQRKRDAAVEHELERQRQERLAQMQAEAEAAAEQQRIAQEQAAQQQAAQFGASDSSDESTASEGSSSADSSASGSDSSDSSDSSATDDSDSSVVTPPPALPPPAPPPPPPPPPPSSGLVCPVQGAAAYSDTWGAARSEGRTHEGVDMMAAEGTPLVAVTSGYVELGSSSLGGNSARLSGGNGDYYFYAHLSAYEGSSRDVRQGEVIGYVGHTGNTTADHLHFEVHPGHGEPINPYPTVVAAGC